MLRTTLYSTPSPRRAASMGPQSTHRGEGTCRREAYNQEGLRACGLPQVLIHQKINQAAAM